jgi:hypothetical protein
MTNTYRVTGFRGASAAPWDGAPRVVGTVLSVTATEPETEVSVTLSPTAKILASANGEDVPAVEGGKDLKFKLANAGDVLQLVTEKGQEYDLSGSLALANKLV